jgi:PilZ domain-containing protein
MRSTSVRRTQEAAEILAGLPSPVQAFSGDGSVLPLRIGPRHGELIAAEVAATRARRGLWLVVRTAEHEIEMEIARVQPKGAWMARIGLRVMDIRDRPTTRQSPRAQVSETAKVYVLGARSVTTGEQFHASVADVSVTGLAMVADRDLHPGDLLAVMVEVNRESVRMHARVLNAEVMGDGSRRAGAQIVQIPDRGRRMLQRLVA